MTAKLAPTAAPHQDFDKLSGELFRLVRLMERSHARYAARQPDGLERAAFLLLVQLVKCGPQRLSTLADAVHSDVSTVSRQVAALVKSGLVERRADPSDGRASLVAASELGERTFQARRRRRNEMFAELMADWSVIDRRQLRTLVSRFNDDFEAFFLPTTGTTRTTNPETTE
jgi:DNA-binding MarR family transcriptional regulator